MPTIEFNKDKERLNPFDIEQGDLIITDRGDVLLVARVDSNLFNLINPTTGNRHIQNFTEPELNVKSINSLMKTSQIKKVVKSSNYKIKLDINWEA